MADNTYQVGEPVPIQATFKNAAGTLTNTTVTLEVRAPDGTITAPTITNTSTGLYDATVPAVTQPGLWWYSFIGTGAVAATEQNSFYVQARYTQAGQYPLSTSALITLDEAREYVQGSAADDRIDDKLIDRINEMSAAVKTYTRREWLPLVTAATRKFVYPGYGILSLAPYDLRSATLVKAYTDYPTSYQVTVVPGDTTVTAEYKLRKGRSFAALGTYRWVEFSPGPYTNTPMAWPLDYDWGGRLEVSITGDWGIGVVPADVKLAVKIAVKNSIENPEGAGSRTVGPLTISEPLDNLGEPDAPWRALPSESRALLAPFRDDPALVAA